MNKTVMAAACLCQSVSPAVFSGADPAYVSKILSQFGRLCG